MTPNSRLREKLRI